ncbi:MAG: GAF domain-containing protein [Cytophagales bacterium]|nr:MAG: GAF domain-containing protein [Cytophagales bacterium]
MLTQEMNLLFEANNSLIYESIDEQNQKVIVKVLKNDRATKEDLALFFNEYTILDGIEIAGVRKVLKKSVVDGRATLWFEWVKGQSLKDIFNNRAVELREFLHIAIQICQILGEVHHHNIIHKDINGNNIIYDEESKKITLIDFGISSKLNLKTANLGNPEKLEGTLNYIAPEQTGRMNRIVDYRADLYSLGIFFYELITGQLPFRTQDPMELVHAHIAQTPPAPHEVNEEVPEIVSDILLKLLSKNAEDRYQSAFGVKNDLEKIQHLISNIQYLHASKLKAIRFPVAQEDFSGKLQIPQKLYGREEEIDQLMLAYKNACKGDTELFLVAGYSGVGKSALINEIHRPVTEQKGYFIEGKFDQFQKDVPYYAWIQAFKGLVSQLLTVSIEDLEKWKQKILKAVGNNGKVLTEVIPALELIIGEQPEIADLGAAESQNRFNFVFQNFVNAISKKEHPLVIFVDDWQWADTASINLLKVVLDNQNEDYLLIIGAYRDNEIYQGHPFLEMVDQLQEESIAYVRKIELSNLKKEHAFRLIADSLQSTTEYAEPLCELIYSKTQGNAFFVNQTLRTLYEEGLLQFDFEKKNWLWDIDKINNLNITDNVVELMTQKVQRLPEDTQKALKLAACIGNRFNLPTLSMIEKEEHIIEGTLSEIDELSQNARKNLENALMEGYVIPLNLIDFKFAHDRIQQAVYSMMSDDNKKVVHLKIGKLLLQNIPSEKQDLYIFDIVNQWNLGVELVINETERKILAELNLKAGKKAKASSAYNPAFNYLQTALHLLPADIWQTDYIFALEVYSEAAHTAFLKGDFIAMEHYIEVSLANALTVIDKVPAYEVRMQYHISRGEQQEALLTGLRVLKMLRVPLSVKPPTIENIPQIIQMPEMTDEIMLAAMDIMDSIITPAWASQPLLFQQICYTMANLTIRHGLCASSAAGFAFYGGLLCGTFNEIDAGYEMGKLAVAIVEKFNAKYIKSKVDNLYVSTVMHWKEPARATIRPHADAIQIGLETGDIEFASYNIVESSHYHFIVGMNLDTLRQRYERNIALILQLKQIFHHTYIAPWYVMVQNFIGANAPNIAVTDLINEEFDERKMLPQIEADQQLTLAFVAYEAKATLALFFREIKKAYQFIQKAEEYKGGVVGMLFLPVHNFMYSIILLQNYSTLSPQKQEEALNIVSENQEQLNFWASHSPDNSTHRYHLVNAEKMKLLGRITDAMEAYDKAIDFAKKGRFLHEEALANELAGEFYLSINKPKIAKSYLADAYYLYQFWGATKKVEDLENRHAKFVKNPLMSITTTNNTTIKTSTTSVQTELDMSTIIKASQTLSGEVVLGKLLEKMMLTVLENAGAERGLLILEENNKWLIEAIATAQNDKVEVFNALPIESVSGSSESPMLSNAIVNYVIRTRENIVLTNALEEGKFTKDLYVQKMKPKSVLCLPLINQGQLTGILYLENNLTIGAFTNDRLNILTMLSSQMAISIENALLYENLEEKVRERTAQLNEAYLEIEKKNHDITSSINYAKRIQSAMLPARERIRESLPESFIYFRPRDIVSGDFYWFSEKNDRIIITAVDCTGHGVPGAFMSLIGNELLHEIVNLRNITDAGEILTQLHKGVNNALKQSETDNKDGMDLALCVIDLEKKTLDFSGAKNPMIYIQNGEVMEFKGDKLPIGGSWSKEQGERTFKTQTLHYGDTPTYVYLSSDGYEDQFGGAEGMKFMKKKFKNMLLEIHQKDMDEQRQILKDAILSWMGDKYKQLDDILVVGFKLN